MVDPGASKNKLPIAGNEMKGLCIQANLDVVTIYNLIN